MQRADGVEPFVLVRLTRFQRLNGGFSRAQLSQAITTADNQLQSSRQTITKNSTTRGNGWRLKPNCGPPRQGCFPNGHARLHSLPYRPRYDSTSLESSLNGNLKVRFDGDAPITTQWSRGPLLPSPTSIFDPQDHLYIPLDQTAPPSPPPLRPEKSQAGRLRVPL